MMKSIYIFLITIFSNLLNSQNKSVDTLKKYTYSQLEETFYHYNNESLINEAKLVSKYYLQKAKLEKNKDQIVEGYIMVHFNENLSTALKYIDSINTLTLQSDKNIYPARIYLLRGNLYFKFDKQIKALENYILALKYAKEKNNNRQIAFAEINIAYLHNYIGRHKEAAKTLKYYLYNANYLGTTELNDIHLNLASTYLDINKLDSANILITEGLKSSRLNDIYRYNKYLSLYGLYNLRLKKYNIAIKILSKSKDFFLTKNDELSLNYSLTYLGQSYAALNKKKEAIQCFIKIDSIVQKTNNTFPELNEVYTYLIDYYKEKNDNEKQLFYIERFLKIEKILNSQRYVLSKELPQKYDTPKLLQAKENIIKDLRNRKTILYISVSILILILLLVTYLYYKSKKKEKQYRKIAQELINSVETRRFAVLEEKSDAVQTQEAEQVNTEDKISKTTPEDVAQIILKDLEIFEMEELFLKKGITLVSLAKSIKTNTAYLSDTINTHKEKNFAVYLNDLRITYALNRLVKDKKFRSYKLSIIAEELGYNNEQAFSLAFKKKTGTTLSIYIKEIEKTHTIHLTHK